MSTMQVALSGIAPQLKLVEPGLKHTERVLQLIIDGAAKMDRAVMGIDKITRLVGAIELPDAESTAIAWFRENGIKRLAAAVLAIRLSDHSLVYEIRVGDTKIRDIHVVGRLRKAEAYAQAVVIPKQKWPLLTVKGQPDFKALRQWSWDPEGTVVIRSMGTTRLAVAEVFATVANSLAENLGIVGCSPPRADRRLQAIRRGNQ